MQRSDIERQTQEYLMRGGIIHKVDHTANKSYQAHKRKTRKQHQAEIKRSRPAIPQKTTRHW